MHKQGEKSLFCFVFFTKANTIQIDIKTVASSNYHFTFCLMKFTTLKVPHINGIKQDLSFCDWLISQSIMFS